jgi:hypothetical protein
LNPVDGNILWTRDNRIPQIDGEQTDRCIIQIIFVDCSILGSRPGNIFNNAHIMYVVHETAVNPTSDEGCHG